MEHLNLFFSIVGWLFVFLFILAIFSLPIMGFFLISFAFCMLTFKELKFSGMAMFGVFGLSLAVHLAWCYYLDKRKFYDNIR